MFQMAKNELEFELYSAAQYAVDRDIIGEYVSTGYPSLDKCAQLETGRVNVILSAKDFGKTMLMLNLAYNHLKIYPETRAAWFALDHENRFDVTRYMVYRALRDMVRNGSFESETTYGNFTLRNFENLSYL